MLAIRARKRNTRDGTRRTRSTGDNTGPRATANWVRTNCCNIRAAEDIPHQELDKCKR